jgi:hypothetical protein
VAVAGSDEAELLLGMMLNSTFEAAMSALHPSPSTSSKETRSSSMWWLVKAGYEPINLDFRFVAIFISNPLSLSTTTLKSSQLIMTSLQQNEGAMWRTNLVLQVSGQVQVAPVVVDDESSLWGLYSVNALGMRAGHKILLTGPLQKVITAAASRKKVRKNKMNYEGGNGNGDGSDGSDELKVGCDDDENDLIAHLLPIVDVSDQLKSKFTYKFCTE